MDDFVRRAVEAWLASPAIAEEHKREIRHLVDAGDDTELTNRFFQDLEFGTGGMRGILGAGVNRMNIYTVGLAAQGLANYVAEQGEEAKQAGVAIAYDCRRMSPEFAERTACVLAGNGITAHVFKELRPTPQLSFAVRHLGCTAGVVITASHNPPEYNGFKVYWSDGVQVVPPHDQRITEEVSRVGGYENVKAMTAEEARSAGLYKTISGTVDEAFLKGVQASCLNPEVCQEQGQRLKIVFTGLHGTGSVHTPEALRRRGFEHVLEVPEQAAADGEFPTVESPNPEEGAALTMGIELARREGADLVIGTDPDADRVGIAVRGPDGDFELITGNQIGALLTYYICEQLTRDDRFPEDAVMITTIVSGDMMKTIARAYGAEVIETLTGFKWIGEKVSAFEAMRDRGEPSKTYIFGAEESYGYMPSPFVRDKDAVTSAAYIAELAAVAATSGRSLYGLLQELFARFGYFREAAKSIMLPGAEGAARIKAIMEQLRNDPPRTFGGIPVATIADIAQGERRDARSGEVIEKLDLPASNVLCFVLEDGTKVIARPSGTEPKIKFYVLTQEKSSDVDQAREAAERRLNAIMEDITRQTSG